MGQRDKASEETSGGKPQGDSSAGGPENSLIDPMGPGGASK